MTVLLRYGLLLLLTSTLLFSCKKREERDLIKNYIGIYSVTHISTDLDNNQIVSTTEYIELEVKKSCKGIKIDGVKAIDNFDVNYTDSSFSGSNTKHRKALMGGFILTTAFH